MHFFNKYSPASKHLSMPALIVKGLLPASSSEKHAELAPAMMQLEASLRINGIAKVIFKVDSRREGMFALF